MVSRSTLCVTVVALALIPLAGCLGAEPAGGDVENATDPVREAVPALELADTMNVTQHVVEPAVHLGHGLYEPTIDVSSSGVLYISSHTTGVDAGGAPAYFSTDDGESWQPLPFAGPAQAPSPLQMGAIPPTDEIFIVAGDDGQAWGVDITLATFPVNGWCNDGAEHCYHNPDAYDEARAQTSRVDALSGQDGSCSVANLNDRPWAAYEDGTLLLVNNPGGGPVQVASMQVPPPTYAGVWNPVQGPQWNLCAGEGGGGIPGIPDIREDGFFAVPQMQDGKLVVVTGNAEDVMEVEQRTVFSNSHESISAIGVGDQVVFDSDGKMFVGAMNNAAAEPGEGNGGIHLAVSTDDGRNFTERTIRFDRPVSSIYMDGNAHGPGAVINWGLTDSYDGPTDWYLGHLHVGPNGTPVIRNASLVVEDGPPASRHVQGASVGPDGRAYMVMSEVSGNDDVAMAQSAGTTPLSVVVQQTGPTLPVAANVTAAE